MSKKEAMSLRYFKRKLKVADLSGTWQNILWREIKHSADHDYVQRLQKAIAVEKYESLPKTRPTTTEVELALRQGCRRQSDVRHVWQRRLQRLYSAKHKPTPVEALLENLNHEHWLDRFIARHILVYRGGEVIEPLSGFARSHIGSLNRTALWLLKSIGTESYIRFALEKEMLLCPQCLLRCTELWLDLPWQRDITYIGCRGCGQNRRLIHCPHEVRVVLDNHWAEASLHQKTSLRVNWFKHPTPFDFDSIEIGHVTDEQVERFAVQMGNDTELQRALRYKTMPYSIRPDSQISANSVRILDRQFGVVEQLGYE